MPYCTRITTAAALICFVWLGWVTVSFAQTANQSEKGVRLFQSRDGATQYVGKLVKLNGSRVTLELEEGETEDLRLSDLRREDQVWIRAADRAMRLVAKRREQAKELIEDLAGAKADREIKSICIKLREFGELAAEAQLQLQGLMNDQANGEIAYHAAVTFAVVSPKNSENWEALLKVLKDGNPQLMLLTQRAPGPMLAAMSLYGQQAFPLLQAAAFTGEITLVAEDWSAAELKKLNTVRGPKNAARASACLALGQIQSEAARTAVRSVIKEAAVKLNGMADNATIEACLAAFGRLGDSNASETLTSYEDQFPATVKKSRELITQYQERAKALAELNKFRSTRLFTDRRGNRVRASLENLSDGRVRLKKLDEKMVVVPLENFSEDDQAWILARVEAMGNGLSLLGKAKPIPAGIAAGPIEPATDEQANLVNGIVVVSEGKMKIDFDHPILKGCVGWWPLTDGGGDRVVDISQHRRHLASRGEIAWVKNNLGNHIAFDGIDDHLVSDVVNFDFASYTLCFWVNFKQLAMQQVGQYCPILVIGDSKGVNDLEVYLNEFDESQMPVVFHNRGNGHQDASANWSSENHGKAASEYNGVWSHWVISYDSPSRAATVYINGERLGESKVVENGAVATVNKRFFLNRVYSRHATGDGSHGEYDLQNVRFWNRSLEAEEIQQLYAEPWVGLKPIDDSEEGADKE